MITEATTRTAEGRRKRRTAVLAGLAVGAALAAVAALAGTAQQAEAVTASKIVFTSNRIAGTGVDNPTGDYEIFRMNSDGTGVRQLTFNKRNDFEPVPSPDGTKVAYTTYGIQPSNPEGDNEVYVMNTLDGSGKKNPSNNGDGIFDGSRRFSPGGKKVAYGSFGKQPTNPEGDYEVYSMNATDGSEQINLSNNGADVDEYRPGFSPDGTSVVYETEGIQPSNPQGDREIYSASTLDGNGKRNLTDNKVAYDGYYLPGQM